MSPTPTSDETVRILLIEEYNALALAIELALRKFSPRCEIMRYGNVAEAWEGAQRRPPQLVVLDHDPPSTGAISFFQDLRELAPDARLLLIASTSRRGQITDLGCVGALRLVEKPFDLQQLGEAVRSQLEPNSAKRLHDFAVSDCIALACLAAASVRLEISSHGKRAGEIDLVRGQITHAETESEKGETALVELLRWSKPLCHESYSPSAVARSIKGDWIEVLTRVSKQVMPAGANPPMERSAPRIRPSAENQPELAALPLDPAQCREQPMPSEEQSYSSVRSENGSACVAAVAPRE
ncbi:MAG: response regulator, partial [Verrucomicrobiota bacterium]